MKRHLIARWLYAFLFVGLGVVACGRTTDAPPNEDGGAGATALGGETALGGASPEDSAGGSGGTQEEGSGGRLMTGGAPGVGGGASGGRSAVLVPDGSWIPMERPPSGQTDCEQSLLLTDAACTYQLHCEGGQFRSRCEPGPGDSLLCGCLNQNEGFTVDYLVSADERETACQDTIALCVFGAVPPDQEVECIAIDEQVVDQQCSAKQICTVPGTLPNGFSIDLVVSKPEINCTQEANSLACSCRGDNPGARPEVYGTDLSQACGLAVGLCRREVSFGDEWQCGAMQESAGSDSCSSSQLCGFRTDLGTEGAYAVTEPSLTTSTCSEVDGATSCQCENGIAQRTFDVRIDGAIDPEMCRSFAPHCADGEVFPTTGPVACEDITTTSVSDLGACESETPLCYQSGDLGSFAASVRGFLSASCEEATDGEWSCRCRSLGETDPFTVSGTEGSLVCPEAFELCQARTTSASALDEMVYFQFD